MHDRWFIFFPWLFVGVFSRWPGAPVLGAGGDADGLCAPGALLAAAEGPQRAPGRLGADFGRRGLELGLPAPRNPRVASFMSSQNSWTLRLQPVNNQCRRRPARKHVGFSGGPFSGTKQPFTVFPFQAKSLTRSRSAFQSRFPASSSGCMF